MGNAAGGLEEKEALLRHGEIDPARAHLARDAVVIAIGIIAKE